MGERKVKQVSFNLAEEHERKLFEHTEERVFSKYVKRLIDRDINGGSTNIAPQEEAPNEGEIKHNPNTFI